MPSCWPPFLTEVLRTRCGRNNSATRNRPYRRTQQWLASRNTSQCMVAGIDLVCGRRLRCRLRRGILRSAKIYFGNLARSFRGFEVSIVRLEPGPSGINVVRELLNVCVVVLQCVVITLALDGDAIFRPRQFIL